MLFVVGATTNNIGTDPTYWVPDDARKRCPLAARCFESGDYASISSNAFAAASTPFVNQNVPTTFNDMLQSFVEDPQGRPNVPNFTPHPLQFPGGADISGLARPIPPQSVGGRGALITGISPPRRP